VKKEPEQAQGTHRLESADGGVSQNTERIRMSEGYSQTEEHKQRDKSGLRKNQSKQGALTDWRAQMER